MISQMLSSSRQSDNEKLLKLSSTLTNARISSIRLLAHPLDPKNTACRSTPAQSHFPFGNTDLQCVHRDKPASASQKPPKRDDGLKLRNSKMRLASEQAPGTRKIKIEEGQSHLRPQLITRYRAAKEGPRPRSNHQLKALAKTSAETDPLSSNPVRPPKEDRVEETTPYRSPLSVTPVTVESGLDVRPLPSPSGDLNRPWNSVPQPLIFIAGALVLLFTLAALSIGIGAICDWYLKSCMRAQLLCHNGDMRPWMKTYNCYITRELAQLAQRPSMLAP